MAEFDPPGGGGSGVPLVPWTTLVWVNGASAEAPITGSIGAPYTDVQAACDAVASQGTVLVGVGSYAGPITIAGGKVIHITGQGNAEGGAGGNASIGGFDLTSSFVRLQSIALTAGITVTGTGALFGYNVTFATFGISGPGTSNLTLVLVNDGMDLTSPVGPVACNTLRTKNLNYGDPVSAVGVIIASECAFFDTVDGATGFLDSTLFEGDVTFTGEADFIDCRFTVGTPINIAASPLRMDAVSYGRAVAAGCTFGGPVTFLDGSSGILNESTVLGNTVTDALDNLAGLAAPVTSVFGRTGAVTAQAGDYTAAQVTGAVPDTRTITSGAGLTGGGNLSADRTLAVGANADGSITVNADDVQVGILATDAQHGNRGGGAIHAAATTSTAGFLSSADKTKLNGLPALLRGTDLADSNSTQNPSSGSTWRLPLGTCTAARVYTPGTTGARAGELMEYRIYDTSANTKTIELGATDVVVGPSNAPTIVWVAYDGANWYQAGIGYLEAE